MSDGNGPLRVLLCVHALAQRQGGPPRSVAGLAGALADRGTQVDVVGLDLGHGWSDAIATPSGVRRTTIRGRYCRALGQVWAPGYGRTLLSLARARDPSVLHDNGVWWTTNVAAAAVATRLDLPLVVSPRGMLDPWSLARKARKKRWAWRAYQRRVLRRARVVHATSWEEAAGLRRLGLGAPIAVVPNGVLLPATRHRKRTSCPRPRRALFLSRIHPGKGLLDLVEAWDRLRPSNWVAIVAGPDEGNHRAAVEEEVRARELEDRFRFVGAAYGTRRDALLGTAELFVLPTRGESFGTAIAEALAAGVPVITTTAAPWSELRDHGCGWWVQPGVDALTAALGDAFRRSAADLWEMGERGRDLVRRRYSWERVAEQMEALYRWVTGGAAMPAFVRND